MENLFKKLIYLILSIFLINSSLANDVDSERLLIEKFEGFELSAYKCSSGKITIGSGITHYENGNPIKIDDQITLDEANNLYDFKIKEVRKQLNHLVKVELTNNQESALVSFLFNVGYGQFEKSKLLKMINSDPYDFKIQNEFMKWTKSKGKTLKGLEKRRKEESKLYFTKTKKVMAVEIYLEPELQEMVGSPEVTEEWKKLAEELQMEGQLKLITPRSAEDSNKNPSPYIHMNKKAERVFSILCSEVVNYKKYDKSTIPREVLREIALVEKEKYFDKVCIWYDDASPDPLVVGYIKDGSYNYIKHLIARFGDELLPFEVLESKAISRMKKRMTDKLLAATQGIDMTIDDYFNPKTYGSDDITITFPGTTYSHKNGC